MGMSSMFRRLKDFIDTIRFAGRNREYVRFISAAYHQLLEQSLFMSPQAFHEMVVEMARSPNHPMPNPCCVCMQRDALDECVRKDREHLLRQSCEALGLIAAAAGPLCRRIKEELATSEAEERVSAL